MTPLRAIIATCLLACLLGCGVPPDEQVFVEVGGRTYTVPEMAQEIYDLRAELQAERDKDVPPSTVCSCNECKCELRGTFNDVRPGWSRLCQCEAALKRECEEAVKVDSSGPTGKAKLLKIREIRVEDRIQ